MQDPLFEPILTEMRKIAQSDDVMPEHIACDYDKAVHYAALYKGTQAIIRDALSAHNPDDVRAVWAFILECHKSLYWQEADWYDDECEMSYIIKTFRELPDYIKQYALSEEWKEYEEK